MKGNENRYEIARGALRVPRDRDRGVSRQVSDLCICPLSNLNLRVASGPDRTVSPFQLPSRFERKSSEHDACAYFPYKYVTTETTDVNLEQLTRAFALESKARFLHTHATNNTSVRCTSALGSASHSDSVGRPRQPEKYTRDIIGCRMPRRLPVLHPRF